MIKDYKYFIESKKDKFPNIQKKEFFGYTIFIGRDAKSNDYLTFNTAENEDIWMHVKGYPGSHIVIRVRENLPTPEVIKYAAELAKKNSKANKVDNATVVYCQAKFVTKEPNMNDGQVRVDYNNSEEITI